MHWWQLQRSHSQKHRSVSKIYCWERRDTPTIWRGSQGKRFPWLTRCPGLPFKSNWRRGDSQRHSPQNKRRTSVTREKATATDATLAKLGEIILKGWPDHRADTNVERLPYYNYRDELTVQDGIIYRGERIVIPRSLRQEMKSKIHAGHLGVNSCLRRARDLLYWPNSPTCWDMWYLCHVRQPTSKGNSRNQCHSWSTMEEGSHWYVELGWWRVFGDSRLP